MCKERSQVIRDALALHRSMAECGELPSKESRAAYSAAMAAVDELEAEETRTYLDRRAAEAAADTGRAQDQRAEFEAWASGPPKHYRVERFADDHPRLPGEYEVLAVQVAWEAWQQARKAQEPQPAGALEWRDRKAQVGDLTFEVARLYGHWYVIVNAPDDLYAMEGVMLRVQTSEQAPDAPAVEARLRAFFAGGLAVLSGNSAPQSGEEGGRG